MSIVGSHWSRSGAPWHKTATVTASEVARSRSWVVSSTVVPDSSARCANGPSTASRWVHGVVAAMAAHLLVVPLVLVTAVVVGAATEGIAARRRRWEG